MSPMDARSMGHVALVIGGDSAEREISLRGGQAVARALDALGVQHSVVDGPRRLLEQIASAVNQQSSGNRQLAESAEAMRDIAAHGKQSTGEQSRGVRQITQSTEQIRSMITRIDDATKELSQRSRQVVEAVSSVHKVAEGNAGRTAELDQVVEILDRLTGELKNEVGAFKA